MSIEQLYDVCDICDVCDGLCDCVRCHTESSTDDNKIDTGTISKTTSSQYSLASKSTEINIITKSKPDNSYEDIIARTTGKECLNNYSNSRNSTTNLETTIHQDFNTNYSSSKEFDVCINSIFDCRAVKRYFNNVVKIIYSILLITRVPTLVVYLGYDIKCAINEEATFANCTQEFFVKNPKDWVLCSKTISTSSSVILLYIIWLNRQKIKYKYCKRFRKMIKEAKFWGNNFMFALTFVYYLIRYDKSDKQLSIALLLWWPATMLVMYNLNCICPIDLTCRWLRIGYWLTLVIHCAETFCVSVAVMLAAQQKIIPVIQKRDLFYPVKAFAILVVWVRTTLAFSVLTFFFTKIFNCRK